MLLFLFLFTYENYLYTVFCSAYAFAVVFVIVFLSVLPSHIDCHVSYFCLTVVLPRWPRQSYLTDTENFIADHVSKIVIDAVH